ncbi:hypothetical protein VC83_08245 [Pseudogymnoascus destructans]|uniref:TeaA receptor TeaR n=2 Tax=Pseudogymnoascus destructans TaxID=655981 RepID=L8FWL8_PSED2|nr:uncharacterized protein VC83_08245 [Pseudogymnoascus destructans]ELR05292.1 hypothetical protein GMDG_07275 [Pseudogymnoascus destructans 20631-21]OAF55354.1 hypothetical protein VC83_08245 [Pseudogymnoascus destructans]
MAAVSAPQATGALTPPTSSDGNASAWDYSVPSGNQQSTFPRQQHDETSHAERKQMTPHPNGSTRRNDAARQSRSNSVAEPVHAPPRLNNLTKKGSMSGTDSPSDSLVDLYSSGPGKSAANGVDHSERGREENSGASYHEDDPGWIHRDKLARIESRELQAAGIILPRTRAYSRRNRSRDTSATGLHRNEQHPVKQQRVESPTAEELEDDDSGWDPRTPEEIAADANPSYRGYGSLSKGSSKIPLALTSPAPIPWEYLERDAPIQRSRSAVWGGEDDSIANPLPRAKASSEEPLFQPTPTTTPSAPKRFASTDSSPKKSANATPTNRKMSATSVTSKPPLTQQTQKQKGRSGSNSRPTTRSGEIKTPEGDPPWLASMYKPDPRLPPDQQLLPTVARRLQQEQWEKEGKFGNVYDRDFRPLNDDEIKMPEAAAVAPEEQPEAKQEELPQWPLRKARSPEPSHSGTSSGYSTMPRIQNAPPSRIQSPMLAQFPVHGFQPEVPEKNKGCGCCVVM